MEVFGLCWVVVGTLLSISINPNLKHTYKIQNQISAITIHRKTNPSLLSHKLSFKMNIKKSVKTSDESFDGFSSVFSLKENQSSSGHQKKSKAYAAAMKALQDKLIELDSENISLKQKIQDSESKRQIEKQTLEIQIQEDRQRYEKIFKNKLNDLEQQEKNSQKTIKKLNDSLKVIQIKLKFNEDQVLRLNEQLVIDKENFILETECIKKSLEDSKNNEKEVKEELIKAKREKKVLKDQLVEQEKYIETLREEVEYLKEHNKEHKLRIEENFKSIKSELILKNQENLAIIKQLNMKNKNLQRVANDSKKQGEFFKIQCIKLSQKARESQETAKEMKKSRSKSRNFESVKPTNRRSVSSLRFSDATDTEVTYDDCIGQAINNKEVEIRKLSDRYNKMQSVQLDTNEIENFQRNLEDICVCMDRKNKELYELKRKQRDQLKLKLVA